jgi:hypothetical protein
MGPKLTGVEIDFVVNDYIGVFEGYLLDGIGSTMKQFYRDFCNLNIDPDARQVPGSKREQFRYFLWEANPIDQAGILLGIVKKCSTSTKHIRPTSTATKIKQMALRLVQPEIDLTSEGLERMTLEQLIDRIEALKQIAGATANAPADTMSPAMIAAELEARHRELLLILDLIEPPSTVGSDSRYVEQVSRRIIDLRTAKKVPDLIFNYMMALNLTRNKTKHERQSALSLAERGAAKAAWVVIKEWAVSEGFVLPEWDPNKLPYVRSKALRT